MAALMPGNAVGDSNGHVQFPLQSSFRATPSSEQTNLSINAWNTIAFGNEPVDTNGDFASSTFTAPVDGTYALNVNLYLQNIDSCLSQRDNPCSEVVYTTHVFVQASHWGAISKNF